MALKATVYKAALQIADMDRHYYQDHLLTLARHPSETDERMMVRLLAFALHADEGLTFTKGLCADDEPDLWLQDLSGNILLWIDVGQPDEKRIRKACGRAERVAVYCYGGRSSDIWWDSNAALLARHENLAVVDLPKPACQALAQLAQRNMQLQITIQEQQVWVADQSRSVALELEYRKRPASI